MKNHHYYCEHCDLEFTSKFDSIPESTCTKCNDFGYVCLRNDKATKSLFDKKVKAVYHDSITGKGIYQLILFADGSKAKIFIDEDEDSTINIKTFKQIKLD